MITHKVAPSTICQCTGHKDKNGKLIWENDIMVGHLDDDFPEDTTYAMVVWHNNGFYTKEQGSEDIFAIDEFTQEHFEACGNRFDNPELLEVSMTENEVIDIRTDRNPRSAYLIRVPRRRMYI